MMKNNHRRAFLCLLGMVLFASTTFAISVDRIVLVQRQPDVYVRFIQTALNTKTGQTLVTWIQRPGWGQRQSIRGQLLGPDGKPVGSSFQILSSSTNPGEQDVLYDPEADRFILAYNFARLDSQGRAVTSEIHAIHLKPNGRKKGKSVQISQPAKSDFIYNRWPILVYDSVNKTSIIFWIRDREAPPNPDDPTGIFGAVLDSNLSIRQKPVFIETVESGPGITFGPWISDAAIHPSGKILLAQVLFTPSTPQSEFSIAEVDADLKSGPATITNLTTGPEPSGCIYGVCFDISLMHSQNGQIAALYSQIDGIRKRKFTSSGAILNKETKFFPEPLRAVPLKISGTAFSDSGTSKQSAVLGFIPSEIDDAEIWLQLTSAKGKAVGSPFLIDSGVDCVHGGTIATLPAAVPDGHLFAVLYREGERDNPELANFGAGLVLLRVNTAP